MRILFLNHYAGSLEHGMEYRTFYLAREWVRAGHSVRVVASSFSHVRTKQPDMGGERRRDEKMDGVEYTWLAGSAYDGNGVRRVWSMLMFLRHLYARGRQLVREVQPDVVIASSTYPMDIWPARRTARMARAKLLYEVHDLWPLSPMELGGMSRWHPFVLWAQAAEDYAYRNADCVVSLLPYVQEHMGTHGLDLAKLSVVPNGIDPDEWGAESPELPELVQRRLACIRQNSRAIVGYAGGHSLSNSLAHLLQVMKTLNDTSVALVLFGDGPQKLELIQMRSELGLENVHFFEPVAKTSVPKLLQWFDLACLTWTTSPLYRFGTSSNKLFDYMMAGCPVVQCIDAPPGPVEHSSCGVSVASDDVQQAVGAIRRLLALSSDERHKMGQRGRDYVLANHTYPVLAARFLDAVRKAGNRQDRA